LSPKLGLSNSLIVADSGAERGANVGKAEVARLAAQRVLELKPRVLGVGSGSTVSYFIGELARRGFNGLTVSTSLDTTLMLKKYGFRVLELESVDSIDLSVDGADEVGPGLYLIKGGGAALLREKVVATLSRYRIYIVDESKVVTEKCGREFPIPIEVIPVALNSVTKTLDEIGVKWKLREAKGKLGPVVTDNGNLILDLDCKSSIDRIEEIKQINGVTAVGLFPPSLVDEVIVGDGRVLRKDRLEM
jgi:ribose 5-phosphate isomerase A